VHGRLVRRRAPTAADVRGRVCLSDSLPRRDRLRWVVPANAAPFRLRPPPSSRVRFQVVIPANAGVHFAGCFATRGFWIPASAGMTESVSGSCRFRGSAHALVAVPARPAVGFRPHVGLAKGRKPLPAHAPDCTMRVCGPFMLGRCGTAWRICRIHRRFRITRECTEMILNAGDRRRGSGSSSGYVG